MLYLNETHLKDMGTDWDACVKAIDDALRTMDASDFAQPVKPYLRYRDPVNRIIAMPAFLGGEVDAAGIKWIASFPKNIEVGLSRAHAVVILNRASTGVPFAILNGGLISAIRTAAVSGCVIRHSRISERSGLTLGMTGFGPIGRQHASMCKALLGDRIRELVVYDPRLKSSDVEGVVPGLAIRVVSCWQDAYRDADLFMTCTVSSTRYINLPPKKGSLQLNVSLRDYQPAIGVACDRLIVDDWDEVCRENTDIEAMSKEKGLRRDDCWTLRDVVCRDALRTLPDEAIAHFNPMGMAAFDIAISTLFVSSAIERSVGVVLPD